MYDYYSSYLRHWGLIEIQLQPLDNFIEVASMETHHIFGYARSVTPVRDGTKAHDVITKH